MTEDRKFQDDSLSNDQNNFEGICKKRKKRRKSYETKKKKKTVELVLFRTTSEGTNLY